MRARAATSPGCPAMPRRSSTRARAVSRRWRRAGMPPEDNPVARGRTPGGHALALRGAHVALQPGLGEAEVAHHGAAVDLQGLGDLGLGEAAEVMQLDDP